MKKVLLIVLALGLFSCSKDNVIEPLLERDYYEVNKNDTFDVLLISNPSTGYSWKRIKDQTNKALDSVNVNYIPRNSDPNIVGGSVNEIWKFKGKEIGTYVLTFELSRPWLLDSTIKTKNITVKIN